MVFLTYKKTCFRTYNPKNGVFIRQSIVHWIVPLTKFVSVVFYNYFILLKVQLINQGAKKVIVTACHSGKLKLTFTSPNIISTSPKNVLMSRLISKFFGNLNSSKQKFTCPIAKSTSPGLSDTTFFARWLPLTEFNTLIYIPRGSNAILFLFSFFHFLSLFLP